MSESKPVARDSTQAKAPRRVFDSVYEMVEALKPSYPVYCLRPRLLTELAQQFLKSFPGRVLYAIKCNPHPAVLKPLYDAGIRHFDTASLPEIAQVRETFPDAKVYFMHPVKSRAVILSAANVYGVTHFMVDHPKELEKVLDEVGVDGTSIIVRLATPRGGAAYDLSAKFGARPADAVELLEAVQDAGCQSGLAFHVGSQCANPGAYGTALSLVGEVLDAAKVDIHYLDVGGGFPAPYLNSDVPPLETFFHAIDAGLAKLDLRRDCVVMCEPGRALVATACSLVVQVQLRKDDQLYINDGIYGSLSELVAAGIRLPVSLIRAQGEATASPMDFTVYGPTCDSLDVLPGQFSLPSDVHEGDWIEIDHIGAYSNALATHFNGFFPETFVQIHDNR